MEKNELIFLSSKTAMKTKQKATYTYSWLIGFVEVLFLGGEEVSFGWICW